MDVNNRANQLNPNNWRFWSSRGYSDRPGNWEALIGPSQLPVAKWLDLLSHIDSLTVLTIWSAKTLSVCAHGIAKGFCYLCTLKGLIVFIPASTVALIYWYYPKELKEYACKGFYGAGALYRYTSQFASDNSVILTEYWRHFNTYHMWHYGVIIPYRMVKTGVIYAGTGLKGMATQIGYYCGVPTAEEPQKRD